MRTSRARSKARKHKKGLAAVPEKTASQLQVKDKEEDAERRNKMLENAAEANHCTETDQCTCNDLFKVVDQWSLTTFEKMPVRPDWYVSMKSPMVLLDVAFIESLLPKEKQTPSTSEPVKTREAQPEKKLVQMPLVDSTSKGETRSKDECRQNSLHTLPCGSTVNNNKDSTKAMKRKDHYEIESVNITPGDCNSKPRSFARAAKTKCQYVRKSVRLSPVCRNSNRTQTPKMKNQHKKKSEKSFNDSKINDDVSSIKVAKSKSQLERKSVKTSPLGRFKSSNNKSKTMKDKDQLVEKSVKTSLVESEIKDNTSTAKAAEVLEKKPVELSPTGSAGKADAKSDEVEISYLDSTTEDYINIDSKDITKGNTRLGKAQLSPPISISKLRASFKFRNSSTGTKNMRNLTLKTAWRQNNIRGHLNETVKHKSVEKKHNLISYQRECHAANRKMIKKSFGKCKPFKSLYAKLISKAVLHTVRQSRNKKSRKLLSFCKMKVKKGQANQKSLATKISAKAAIKTARTKNNMEKKSWKTVMSPFDNSLGDDTESSKADALHVDSIDTDVSQYLEKQSKQQQIFYFKHKSSSKPSSKNVNDLHLENYCATVNLESVPKSGSQISDGNTEKPSDIKSICTGKIFDSLHLEAVHSTNDEDDFIGEIGKLPENSIMNSTDADNPVSTLASISNLKSVVCAGDCTQSDDCAEREFPRNDEFSVPSSSILIPMPPPLIGLCSDSNDDTSKQLSESRLYGSSQQGNRKIKTELDAHANVDDEWIELLHSIDEELRKSLASNLPVVDIQGFAGVDDDDSIQVDSQHVDSFISVDCNEENVLDVTKYPQVPHLHLCRSLEVSKDSSTGANVDKIRSKKYLIELSPPLPFLLDDDNEGNEVSISSQAAHSDVNCSASCLTEELDHVNGKESFGDLCGDKKKFIHSEGPFVHDNVNDDLDGIDQHNEINHLVQGYEQDLVPKENEISKVNLTSEYLYNECENTSTNDLYDMCQTKSLRNSSNISSDSKLRSSDFYMKSRNGLKSIISIESQNNINDMDTPFVTGDNADITIQCGSAENAQQLAHKSKTFSKEMDTKVENSCILPRQKDQCLLPLPHSLESEVYFQPDYESPDESGHEYGQNEITTFAGNVTKAAPRDISMNVIDDDNDSVESTGVLVSGVIRKLNNSSSEEICDSSVTQILTSPEEVSTIGDLKVSGDSKSKQKISKKVSLKRKLVSDSVSIPRKRKQVTARENTCNKQACHDTAEGVGNGFFDHSGTDIKKTCNTEQKLQNIEKEKCQAMEQDIRNLHGRQFVDVKSIQQFATKARFLWATKRQNIQNLSSKMLHSREGAESSSLNESISPAVPSPGTLKKNAIASDHSYVSKLSLENEAEIGKDKLMRKISDDLNKNHFSDSEDKNDFGKSDDDRLSITVPSDEDSLFSCNSEDENSAVGEASEEGVMQNNSENSCITESLITFSSESSVNLGQHGDTENINLDSEFGQDGIVHQAKSLLPVVRFVNKPGSCKERQSQNIPKSLIDEPSRFAEPRLNDSCTEAKYSDAHVPLDTAIFPETEQCFPLNRIPTEEQCTADNGKVSYCLPTGKKKNFQGERCVFYSKCGWCANEDRCSFPHIEPNTRQPARFVVQKLQFNLEKFLNHCRARDSKNVFAIYQDVLSKGTIAEKRKHFPVMIKPLIELCLKERLYTKLVKVVNRYENVLPMSAALISDLMVKCCKDRYGMPEAVIFLFGIIKRKALQVSDEAFKAAFEMFLKTRNFSCFWQLVDHTLAVKEYIVPLAISQQAIAESISHRAHIGQAVSLLAKMPAEHLRNIDNRLLHSLLNAVSEMGVPHFVASVEKALMDRVYLCHKLVKSQLQHTEEGRFSEETHSTTEVTLHDMIASKNWNSVAILLKFERDPNSIRTLYDAVILNEPLIAVTFTKFLNGVNNVGVFGGCEKEFIARLAIMLLWTIRERRLWQQGYTVLARLHENNIFYLCVANPTTAEGCVLRSSMIALLAMEVCLETKPESMLDVIDAWHGAGLVMCGAMEKEDRTNRLQLLSNVIISLIEAEMLREACSAMQEFLFDKKRDMLILGIDYNSELSVNKLCNSVVLRCLDYGNLDLAMPLYYTYKDKGCLDMIEFSTFRCMLISFAASLPELAKEIFDYCCVVGYYPYQYVQDAPYSLTVYSCYSHYEIKQLVEKYLRAVGRHLDLKNTLLNYEDDSLAVTLSVNIRVETASDYDLLINRIGVLAGIPVGVAAVRQRVAKVLHELNLRVMPSCDRILHLAPESLTQYFTNLYGLKWPAAATRDRSLLPSLGRLQPLVPHGAHSVTGTGLHSSTTYSFQCLASEGDEYQVENVRLVTLCDTTGDVDFQSTDETMFAQQSIEEEHSAIKNRMYNEVCQRLAFHFKKGILPENRFSSIAKDLTERFYICERKRTQQKFNTNDIILGRMLRIFVDEHLSGYLND